ncbi:MAG: hypothetical protein AB7V43_18740 [Acidimicrobiia bacterium]
MATADSARLGVVILRVISVVVAVATVAGNTLTVLELGSDGGFLSRPGVVGRQQWGYFLTGIAGPLAFAGLILAASFVLAVYAARLDMDIVLAGDDNADDTDSAM